MIIIANKPGQLGNRLFVFAHFIGNALAHNYRVVNPAFDEYAQYFPRTKQDLFCRFPARKTTIRFNWLRRLIYRCVYLCSSLQLRTGIRLPGLDLVYLDWEQKQDLNEPEFIEKATRKCLIVRGWSFSDKLHLETHADKIRAFFTPDPAHLERVEEVLGSCRQKGEIVVGVHIRRGDYKNFQEGRYYYDWSVYRNVMLDIARSFKDKTVAFLVCSNEPVDRQYFEAINFELGSGHLIEDMYAFSKCNFLIGPPSTYTIWASYYGKVPLCELVSADMSIGSENFKLKFSA